MSSTAGGDHGRPPFLESTAKKRKIDSRDNDNDAVIVLDVGGTTFKTRKITLVSGSRYFAAMLDGSFGDNTSGSEPIFLDRCPEAFSRLLSDLRRGSRGDAIPSSREEQVQLLAEAEFFGCEELARTLSTVLSGKRAVSVVQFVIRRASEAGNSQRRATASESYWRAVTERGTDLRDVIGPKLAARFVGWEMKETDIYEDFYCINAHNQDGTWLEATCAMDDVGPDKEHKQAGGWLTPSTLISASAAHGYTLVNISDGTRVMPAMQGGFTDSKDTRADLTVITVKKELLDVTPEQKMRQLEMPGVLPTAEIQWTESDESLLQKRIANTRAFRAGDKSIKCREMFVIYADSDDRFDEALNTKAEEWKQDRLAPRDFTRRLHEISGSLEEHERIKKSIADAYAEYLQRQQQQQSEVEAVTGAIASAAADATATATAVTSTTDATK
eukprot:g4262.t1